MLGRDWCISKVFFTFKKFYDRYSELNGKSKVNISDLLQAAGISGSEQDQLLDLSKP